jgi:hypothetical protein
VDAFFFISKLVRYHLVKEQQCAAENEQHSTFVKRLFNFKTIHQLKDITMQYQQHLSVEVITNNPTDWKYAPVLVASKFERINLSAAKQAVMWAKDSNTSCVLFRWKNKIGQQQNTPGSDEEMDNAINIDHFSGRTG